MLNFSVYFKPSQASQNKAFQEEMSIYSFDIGNASITSVTLEPTNICLVDWHWPSNVLDGIHFRLSAKLLLTSVSAKINVSQLSKLILRVRNFP